MKELIKIYQKRIIFWYIGLFLFFFTLIFTFTQIIKLFDNYQKFLSLVENKNTLKAQIENLNFWIEKINPENLTSPQVIPISLSFEVNSLSEALFNISPLYSGNGSFFRIKEVTISPCEKSENETFNKTCFYTIKLTGEKIKYAF